MTCAAARRWRRGYDAPHATDNLGDNGRRDGGADLDGGGDVAAGGALCRCRSGGGFAGDADALTFSATE